MKGPWVGKVAAGVPPEEECATYSLRSWVVAVVVHQD